MIRNVKATLFWFGALSMLAFGGCGDGTASYGDNNTQEPDPGTDGDLVSDPFVSKYLGSQMEVRDALMGDEVRFESPKEFRGVLVQMTSFRNVEVEWSVELVGGGQTDWEPLVPDLPEEVHTSSQIKLDAPGAVPGTALILRFKAGAQDVEYLSARYFEELPEDGVLFPHYEVYEEPDGTLTQGQFLTRGQAISRPGRYTAPASVEAAGRAANGRYDSANRCAPSGTFTAGTRTLAQYIVDRFPGARRYEGYNCRRTASGGFSMHGTGRAVDIYVNTIGGDHEDNADNTAGDPIANWLIQNAEELGVQLVIWDRSIWSISRKGQGVRHYCTNCWSRRGNPRRTLSPHNDHLHVELNNDGANMRTAWFRNRGAATDPDNTPGDPDTPSGADSEGVTCNSRTLGRSVPGGDCVQMSYSKYGSTCNWATCNSSGNWVHVRPNSCEGTAHSNAACGTTNQPDEPTNPGGGDGASCFSRTLGSNVDHNTCVQVDYAGRSCAKCGWYKCNDGAWVCTDAGNCESENKRAHANCAEPGQRPDELRIRLEWTNDVDLDLFIREPSGDELSYKTNKTTENDGRLYNDESCKGSRCPEGISPYHEDGVWGESTKQITTGTYTFWVQNYNGKAAGSAVVKVTRTNAAGETTFSESFNINIPSERQGTSPEQTVTID